MNPRFKNRDFAKPAGGFMVEANGMTYNRDSRARIHR
jgi:hypothetical protein